MALHVAHPRRRLSWSHMAHIALAAAVRNFPAPPQAILALVPFSKSTCTQEAIEPLEKGACASQPQAAKNRAH